MATKRKDEVSVGVRMSADLKRWMERVARSEDITMSQIVRRALLQARSLWGESGIKAGRDRMVLPQTPDAARKVGGA